MDHMQHHDHTSRAGGFPWTFVALAALGAAAGLLWTGHGPHVAQALPFLFLLACPFMHLLHGHGGHAHGQGSGQAEPGPAPVRPASAIHPSDEHR